MAETEISLRNLQSFGDVAAEDDSVLEYFLTTEAVSRIANNEVFLVLGRKGSGKTALVRHFSEQRGSMLAGPLSLRGYPWNVHASRIDAGSSPIEAYVSSWKYLIATQLASLLLTSKDASGAAAGSLRAFLTENYGGPAPELDVILRPPKLRLSKYSFEPEILGNKLGSVSLERSATDLNLGLELNALSDAILATVIALAGEMGLQQLSLHFDELDQGLSSLDESRKLMLIGLILAARAVRLAVKNSGRAINPVIYLRSDLWDELDFSDKNKISQTLSLNLEWNSESLQKLIDTRLAARLGHRATWDTVSQADLMRGSQTKWNHILSRTFLRPRDVIKFLNATLVEAKRRSDEPLLFSNEDIVEARGNYSAYLKAELDDEILAHWKHWEDALKACSAISTVTFDRKTFVQEYDRQRRASNNVDADEALQILYSFSVVGYERRSGYGGTSWVFQYADPQAGWDRSASRFKVHLGLKEYAKLREERGQSSLGE